MASYRIFEHLIDGKSFEVWLTDGLLQYVVDGEIRHDITSVEQFLIEAAKLINKPNGADDTIVESTGSIDDDALENYDGGSDVALDTNGKNPTIALQDDGTEVKISGSGVGGSLRIDFGTGTGAQDEAADFFAFADDLLGKATTTVVDTKAGVQIGDFARTVTVSTRDDDIQAIKFKFTGDTRDLSWADIFVEHLADLSGGDQIKNGNVNDLTYNASQLNFANLDGTIVHLGSQGVGGNERYEFATKADAQKFYDDVMASFGPGSDRGDVVNKAVELIADSLGGEQLKNGNVSEYYEARQIKLVGAEKNIVDLGSHRVGGKERYEFDDQETAQKFIDLVRDAFGVEAMDGKLIDENIFKISGGAGIGGSPTFVGNDDFVAFVAEEFGGEMMRNGSVSESFKGGGSIIGDGTQVKLGPSGVGGKEIWDFDSADDANAFLATLDYMFA